MEAAEYERLIVPQIEKRGRQAPPYSEVRNNVSLVLGNSHVSTGVSLALPQNYKPIGGYHIDEEIKPLPEVFISLCITLNNSQVLNSHFLDYDGLILQILNQG